MKLRTLADAPITKGTRVLVRIDSDVVVRRGSIAPEESYRLDTALATFKFLLRKKAVITVMGHMGRPDGKKVAALSLAPVQKYLEKKLKTKLHFLPNVRFDAREEKNDVGYARELATGQDLFVNESFASAHRAHTSVAAITKLLPSYAGIQFEKEFVALSSAMTAPKKPLALIIGGAKLETKVPVIKKFLPIAAEIFVVGAVANNFFAADGQDVGESLVDVSSIAVARSLLKHKNVLLPEDVVYFQHKIFDIGPDAIESMAKKLTRAKTIIWNGPAGYFEKKPFDRGTELLARLLARLGGKGACVIVGGGETTSRIIKLKLTRNFAHISTGGGAMLEFLGGAKLPGVTPLLKK